MYKNKVKNDRICVGNPYSNGGKIERISNIFELSRLWNFKHYVDIYLIFVYLYYIIFIIAWYIYHGKIPRILDRTFHFNRTTNVSHNFRLSNKRNRWSSILSKRKAKKGQNKQVGCQNLHPIFDFSHNFQIKICNKRSNCFVCI